jgi:hypothetical protein
MPNKEYALLSVPRLNAVGFLLLNATTNVIMALGDGLPQVELAR